MALDHYISQVHLRQFYSPALGKRMYAVRKHDGKAFTPDSASVCRIEDGSTNAYLVEDRAIESFLRDIEPKYNAVVAKLSSRQVDVDCVYVVAEFAAYVATCSPAAMRLHSGPLKAMLESTARALDEAGTFAPAPDVLAGASLKDLLDSGRVGFTVDPKYPQAIGIANVLDITRVFGNSHWEILLNDHSDNPFFTSDFPLAIEDSTDPHTINRILPLTPQLAVRIRPIPRLDRNNSDLTFSHFRSSFRQMERRELLDINRLLVRCAEDLVFYRDDLPWVKPFIQTHSAYRIESRTIELATPGGAMQVSTQQVVRVVGGH